MRKLAIAFCFSLAPLSLTACGFTPLHSQAAAAPLPVVNLDFTNTQAKGATGDKVEFLLRQSLKDRMAKAGKSGTSPYTLSLNSKLTRRSLGIRVDDVASRFDLTLSVDYALIEAKSGDVLDRGTVRAVSTFGAPTDPYGRTTAQFDAEERVSTEASDLLILKLARYFKTRG